MCCIKRLEYIFARFFVIPCMAKRKMVNLIRLEDGEFLREATADKFAQSETAARHDLGTGAITVKINGEDVACGVIWEEES